MLKSLDLPSVLIEAGYISSPDDAQRAGRARFGAARVLRRAVASAIEIYLAQDQPRLRQGFRITGWLRTCPKRGPGPSLG